MKVLGGDLDDVLLGAEWSQMTLAVYCLHLVFPTSKKLAW